MEDKELEQLVGKRVKLVSYEGGCNPVPEGTEGTIYNYSFGVLDVKWDNGTDLGLIEGLDNFIIL